MNMNIDHNDDLLCVAVAGRLDTDTRTKFQETTLNTLQETGARQLILDLAATEYISSAGLQAILVVASYCEKNAVRSAVCRLHPEVAKVYKTAGFVRVLNLYDTREGAENAVAAPQA